MNETRRGFLRNGALTALWVAGGCRSFGGGDPVAVNGIRIGVQMYSVEKLWRRDPVSAFRRLRALGYTGVQSIQFYFMDWDELAKMLDGEGLCIVDMPFRTKMVTEERSKFLDFCARFGVDFVFEPSLTSVKPPPVTAADWAKHAAYLAGLGRDFAKNGLRVGFHNHRRELETLVDGKPQLEYLHEAGLPFELDVGHVKLGGHDPVAWLKRLPGRVPSIHAKPGGGTVIGGEGDRNDWPAIFAAAAAAGTKWAVVECEKRRGTYEDVERSLDYLKSLAV